MAGPRPEEQLNLQEFKTGKIYGVIKQGATKQDINAIKLLQTQGYDEHEIQRTLGVHFSVIRSFMALNAKSKGWKGEKFEFSDPAPTPDTQHLHDKIKNLETELESGNGGDETLKAQVKQLEEEKVAIAVDLDTANLALSEATKTAEVRENF